MIVDMSNVGIAIINHPIITILMGGIPTINLMGGLLIIAIHTLGIFLEKSYSNPCHHHRQETRQVVPAVPRRPDPEGEVVFVDGMEHVGTTSLDDVYIYIYIYICAKYIYIYIAPYV